MVGWISIRRVWETEPELANAMSATIASTVSSKVSLTGTIGLMNWWVVDGSTRNCFKTMSRSRRAEVAWHLEAYPYRRESQEADPDEMTVGISTRVRYAFNFVTHIGTTGTIQPEIAGATLTLVADTPTLGIDIANAGTRMLKIEIWTELYDDSGSLVARRDGTPSRVYPSSSRQYQIGLADVSTGDYTALVVIDAGDNNVFGASFPLVLE